MRLPIPFTSFVLSLQIDRRQAGKDRSAIWYAMVGVFLVALLLHVSNRGRLATRYLAQSQSHAQLAKWAGYSADEATSTAERLDARAENAASPNPAPDTENEPSRERRARDYRKMAQLHRDSATLHQARFAYHQRLSGKYARAARWPLLPVLPDPARPE